MNLYQFVILSLIEKISGKRGRGTIIGILRGGDRRSIRSLKNSDNALDERYSGIMERVPNKVLLAISDELLKAGLIEIVEDNINGRWYPLVYVTGKGQDALKEKSAEFLPELEKILNANKVLIDFQAGLIPKGDDADDRRRDSREKSAESS
ncbi:MAG: RQC domain-containing protein [Elusimicrobiota bacterium]